MEQTSVPSAFPASSATGRPDCRSRSSPEKPLPSNVTQVVVNDPSLSPTINPARPETCAGGAEVPQAASNRNAAAAAARRAERSGPAQIAAPDDFAAPGLRPLSF